MVNSDLLDIFNASINLVSSVNGAASIVDGFKKSDANLKFSKFRSDETLAYRLLTRQSRKPEKIFNIMK